MKVVYKVPKLTNTFDKKYGERWKNKTQPDKPNEILK